MSSELPDIITPDVEKDTPLVRHFAEYYPWACRRLFPEYFVTVKKTSRAFGSNLSKVKTSSVLIRQHSTALKEKTASGNLNSFSSVHYFKPKLSFIHAILDDYDALTDLIFEIGSLCAGMIRLISIIIAFHQKFNSLTFKCKIDQHIIYEVSKLLPVSNITILCLDGAFVPQGNFYVLLSEPSALKNLSLARCSINDEIVEKLVGHLCFPKKTCESLIALNLSTNYITDKGAKAIGEMLRSNRFLTYLNLSGNRITDGGLNYILDSLLIFPLTFQEKKEQFNRLYAYIDYKTEMIQQLAEQFVNKHTEKKVLSAKLKKTANNKSETKSVVNNDGTVDGVEKPKQETGSLLSITTVIQDFQALEKAKLIVESTVGFFTDPLGGKNVQKQDNKPYCLGNNTLSYLNLAYNDLTLLCLDKIINVLSYQQQVNRKPKGLMRVVIEGNRLPESCFEYDRLEYLFEPYLVQIGRPRKMSIAVKARNTQWKEKSQP